MPVINRISAYADDMKTWRQHIHRNPELGMHCEKTAEYVVERLKEFGITVAVGLGAGPVFDLVDAAALQLMEPAGYVEAVLGGTP